MYRTIGEPAVGGQLLGSPTLVCLADPVGLYIQLPQNPGAFAFGPNIVPGKTVPAGAQPHRLLPDNYCPDGVRRPCQASRT
jgi:hypothetical protein